MHGPTSSESVPRPPPLEPLRVLVAGPDALARRGLAQVLSGDDTLEVLGPIGLSGDLAAALSLHRPDALLLDEGSAGAPLPAPLDLVAGVPVLVLSPDAEAARRALAAGARGALSREGDPDRIPPALAAVERGLLVLDDAFATLLRSAPPPPEGGFTLTAREHEVLTLLADGLSNREIALRLGFSAHTAKFHVNAVLDKLDATTRTEAVARAVRQGVLRL